MSYIGCHHIVKAGEDPNGEPAVVVWNDLDGYYTEYFTDEAALIAFIAQLEAARSAVWGGIAKPFLVLKQLR